MIYNLLITILRNFRRNKLYSFVNIFGLAIGFTIFSIASLYVTHEINYDHYHVNSDRIYRIVTDNNNYRGFTKFPVTAAPMAPALKDEFPEIESAARISSAWQARLKINNSRFYESRWFFIDPEFFRIFSVDFLEGDPLSALASPSSMVLSESMARKIFGTTKALDQQLEIIGVGNFVVSGIIKDFPDNSVFDMKIITQFEGTLKIVAPENLEGWDNNNYQTFILLGNKANPQSLASKLPYFRDKYTNDKLSQEGGQRSHYLLQPLENIHNDTSTAFELKPAISKTTLFILSTIAIVILSLAGINYVNLTTALSMKRAKEIGVRKVSGASGKNLVFQFLFESIFISISGLVLSIVLILILLPYFDAFIGKPLHVNGNLLLFILGCAIALGILSGIYPAFLLSRYKPATVLKGKRANTKEGHMFRDILVTIQLTVSAVLLIASWVIQNQLGYIQNTNPGYSRDQVITLNWRDSRIKDYWQALKTEITRIPSVEIVSVGSQLPNSITSQQTRRWLVNGEEKTIGFYTNYVDADFIPLLDIKLLAGRNFKQGGEGEGNNYILNETAVKELGLEDPIGARFIQNGTDTVTIIGVVKDFHFASMHQQIAPMRLRIVDNWISRVMVKFNTQNLEEIIWNLEQVSRKFAPDYPFDYGFLDDQFMQVYAQDKKTETIVKFLTITALSLASLGLLGLITFVTSQRYKEVGIRKVFGARRVNLVLLLTSKLNGILLMSFFVAVPIAYYLMSSWLANFVYKIDLKTWPFIASFIILAVIVWSTVLLKILRATRVNPIQVLRYE